MLLILLDALLTGFHIHVSPTLGFQTDCASGKLMRAVREAANGTYEVRKKFECPEMYISVMKPKELENGKGNKDCKRKRLCWNF